MEKTIQILIYIHAAFGGIALLAGGISLLAEKGKTVHKKSGLLFYYAMMISGLLAMFVAVLPNHESPFLFSVGIYSLYFVIMGKRAVSYKTNQSNLSLDRFISLIMIFTGFLMIFLGPLLNNTINPVLVVFGSLGIILSTKDMIVFRKPNALKKVWLKLHLSKMLGGYISATTAFVVVNEYFPNVYAWFVPSIVGGFIIAYWIRKINNKTQTSKIM
ncbi:DUF2306 domain-containing protein [Mesonia ostreae]|uniref:DUF2306 domain-containing protein n=1 Tax=Mesonia ostreae TaxID=861110 RepID=A0ABU2KHV1_9FLAO|nr:DUF2306 domain-containing protein [Mesonia ostreae]MDT0294280.1 DUF2306 domain-containing protein [Mesonia ostreae]